MPDDDERIDGEPIAGEPIDGEPIAAERAEEERIARIVADQAPFARHVGVQIEHATRDRIIARVDVTHTLLNRNGTLHGGAVMAIADTLGGTATFFNLAEGEGTATIESKTNFFRPVPRGDTVRAETVALHKGRRTMVWQTRLIRSDGKDAALVTQTQMILREDGVGS